MPCPSLFYNPPLRCHFPAWRRQRSAQVMVRGTKAQPCEHKLSVVRNTEAPRSEMTQERGEARSEMIRSEGQARDPSPLTPCVKGHPESYKPLSVP